MGTGYLRIEVFTGQEALPVSGAKVLVKSSGGQILYDLKTNENGYIDTIAIEAPAKEASLNPENIGPYYSTCDVSVQSTGYDMTELYGVQIFDTETSILPINLIPLSQEKPKVKYINRIEIPSNDLNSPAKRNPETSLISPRVLKDVIIPNKIIVHLGSPSSSARNVEVPFIDYIKNVASSEIYPTWPTEALEANIYCHITFALNRIYTEWYPSKGYNFNITNSTAYDQFYVHGRNIFENISTLVDKMFNLYVRLPGRKEPYFTQYCNGTTATCPGLSQWGTVSLALDGYKAIDILKYYYPKDLEIVECLKFENLMSSYPGAALREGSSGEDVKIMQDYLNRIQVNYPLIPQVKNPDGIFGSDTTRAVKVFQETFGLYPDGVIGKGSWYKISSIYTAVKRLAELDSEGEYMNIGNQPPTTVYREGNKGSGVAKLQFMLNFISAFYPGVPSVIENASFDSATKASVIAFQTLFGLTPDGVVGAGTWRKLYEIYKGIDINVDIPEDGKDDNPTYPGTLLKVGSTGASVLLMQEYLNKISNDYPTIPKLKADGIFGNGTMQAVIEFQKIFGLSADGIIGRTTWNKIVEEYNKVGSVPESMPYPGYLIAVGSRGDYVKTMQTYLNALSNIYPSIPKITADGIFGNASKVAVIAYQKLFNLTADGIIGKSTWDSIAREYNKISKSKMAMQSTSSNKSFSQLAGILLMSEMFNRRF